MAENRRNCVLCNAQASIYCPADSAFLCRICDVKVHSANFLVARHIRSSLCSSCGNHDGCQFTGDGVSFRATICRSCSPEGEKQSLSSSSSCISSTSDAGDEATASSSEKRSGGSERGDGGRTVAVDEKVEGVLVNWCKRMPVDDRRVVPTVMKVLGGCVKEMTMVPFRVCLTASFWVGLRICRGSATCHNLRRLEQISGVPSKLILALESRLARVLKRKRSRDDHVEGWAEC